MKNEKQELTPEFKLKPARDRRLLDRAEELTLQYNYRKELREARKPNLYGLGIEFYEEERIMAEQGATGENGLSEAFI